MKKILLTVFLIIVSVCVYAATKPDEFHYERSIEISAPANKIFPLIGNYRANRLWSPWEKMDPAMKRTYSGPMTGKGSKYAWDGNKNVGAGNMEILEYVPPTKAVSRLEFTRPMPGVNTAEFNLKEHDGKTTVTWSMYGPNPFMAKVMSVFIDCEKMITEQFDIGLAELKKIAEAPSQPIPDWALKLRKKPGAPVPSQPAAPAAAENAPADKPAEATKPPVETVEPAAKKKSSED